MPSEQQLGLRRLLAFYLPLVLTSQMMTLANPLINLALSRSADPRLHLAAYGVCFGLLVFLNAPVLVTRDVGSGLCEDRKRYRRLFGQSLLVGFFVCGLDLLLAFGPLGRWIFQEWLEATPRVAAEAQRAALAMSPIPVLVGLRGLRSALALRAHRTRLLTQATFGRLVVVSLVLALLVRRGAVEAAWVGWSLTLGIAAETAWIFVVTRPLLRDLPERLPGAAGGSELTWGRLARFAAPLVISAYAWTALRPVINGIIGRTADSEAAQASFGVLHPVILLTASALWALQATGQILGTDREAARRFLRFGVLMTAVFTTVVVLLGWVPALRSWLLTSVFTLPPDLLEYCSPAMRILWIAPVLLGLRSAFKGLVLASGRTGVISTSALIDVSAVILLGATLLRMVPTINGAVLGVLCVVTAESVEATVLGATALHRFGLWPRKRGPRRTAQTPS